LSAVWTFIGTAKTNRSVAFLAIGAAMVTEVIFTILTVIAVFRTHGASAVITAATFPIIDGNIGTGGVIVFKDTDNHREEITLACSPKFDPE